MPRTTATSKGAATLNTVGLSGEGLELSVVPRRGRADLTTARLAEAWPEVSERLGKLLACRGVDPVLAQDIVQDVAVRALDKRVPFTDPDDLYRWAAVAARNLHIDHLRTGGRTTEVETLVGVPDDTDVAYAVERRLALGHVWRAIAVMRPGERDAILDFLHEQHAPRTSGALVRRHRARATLKKAVGGMIAVAAAARTRLRVVSPGVRTAGAVAFITPVLVLDLGSGAVGAAGGAGRAGTPRTTPLVAVATVNAADARRADVASRAAGAAVTDAAAAVRAPRDRYAGEVKKVPNRNNIHVEGPGGATVDRTEEPKQPDDSLVCVLDVPVQHTDVCVDQIPLPNL
jgi:DNA-directed RNA polymerase specialized sigma24 family protein